MVFSPNLEPAAKAKNICTPPEQRQVRPGQFTRIGQQFVPLPAGNIQNLTRRGRIDPDMSPGNPVYDVIDNLSYTYGAGSRLDAVADAANPNFGFKNSSQYGYDAAGNLISDSGKGLTVHYNPLNLPHTVNGPSAANLDWK